MANQQIAAAAMMVAPWAIEADHPRFCDLLLQSIPGCRLRSKASAMKGAVDVKTGDVRVPVDQSRALAAMPVIPGMQLHVIPHELRYRVIDPLHGNKPLLARISRFLEEQGGTLASKNFDGVPPLDGTLDVHQMKTLNREMLNLVKAQEATIVDGKMPTLDDVNDLPGYYLLNPGSRVYNGQPTYEKDYEDWKANRQ